MASHAIAEHFDVLGNLARGSYGLVGQISQVIGNLDLPRKGLGLLGGNLKGQICLEVAQKRVHALIGTSIIEGQANGPRLDRRGLVGHLYSELEKVALAEESRRIGLYHEILHRYHAVGQKPGTHLLVVSESEELPLG